LKEAEDVAAVVNSRPGKVFLLGHSYGGVCALEAAFLTDRVAKLVLYEPPIQEALEPTVISRMESMVARGDRDQALTVFLTEVVKVSPSEVGGMKERPSWSRLAATIHLSPRQMRALGAYRFDPKRMRTLKVPTLLLTGSETKSPTVKRGIASLRDALPDQRVLVFEGEAHFAMDTNPRRFAQAVGDFLLGAEPGKP
jgi:pimeloyl-ACP methyl ester carboxylesterase